jgi:hypothetical protein
MDEIIQLAKRKYPFMTIEMMAGTPSIFYNAFNFNQLKFFFGVFGSAMAHPLYMQPRTVVCQVESERMSCFMGMMRLCGLYQVVSRIASMKHSGRFSAALPMDIAENMIDTAMECLSRTRWENMTVSNGSANSEYKHYNIERNIVA